MNNRIMTPEQTKTYKKLEKAVDALNDIDQAVQLDIDHSGVLSQKARKEVIKSAFGFVEIMKSSK